MPWKQPVHIIGREFFGVALVTYLGLTLVETLMPGAVSNFFNLNYLLLVVLVTGVAMVLTEPAEGTLKQAVKAAGTEVKQGAVAATQQVTATARVATATARQAGTAIKRQVTRRPNMDVVRRDGASDVLDMRQARVTPPPVPRSAKMVDARVPLAPKPTKKPRQLG